MILGIVFTVVWLALAAVWFVMSLMAGAMANDAGTVASEVHARLLITLMVGEALVAVAGPLGGAALAFAASAGLLWKLFAAALILGVVLQVYAVVAMLNAASA
jgi:hypothetical protein